MIQKTEKKQAIQKTTQVLNPLNLPVGSYPFSGQYSNNITCDSPFTLLHHFRKYNFSFNLQNLSTGRAVFCSQPTFYPSVAVVATRQPTFYNEIN
jgi:hypothetical protein